MKRQEALDLIVHDMHLAHASYQRKLYYDVYKELRDGVLTKSVLNRVEMIAQRYRIMYETSEEDKGYWSRHTAGWHQVQRSMSTSEQLVEYLRQVVDTEGEI